ncbi:uncharacterized protein LOC143537421 [Bidens hawaiensis]|uniref:uncharacterized protein LOC143537421 n=1 Tax=Bidens hawaiensis TaxID=980011 RepID=UPI004049AA82
MRPANLCLLYYYLTIFTCRRLLMVRPSSNKQEKINKVSMVKQEHHISGAYIRNLVKHLTSIKTEDHSFKGEHFSDHNNMQQESPPPPPPSPPPLPHKKQVRRRHHTIKPYQERFVNMAEARREIVTALKSHRASMKLVKQPQSTHNHLRTPQSFTTTTASDLENLNIIQDFKILGFYHKPLSNYPMSISSSSSSSSSSSVIRASPEDGQEYISGPIFSTRHEPSDFEGLSGTTLTVISEAAVTSTTTTLGGSDLHHAMDDDEMEKIRSLVDHHQMEWNDNMNLLMLARWFKFLKTIEMEAVDEKDDIGFNLFDQVIEFPPW